MSPASAVNSTDSRSGDSSGPGDAAPLYDSVWQWLRGVLIVVAVASFLVYLLMRWLDYVHRHQYLHEQEEKRKWIKMRGLLGSFGGDNDDDDDDDDDVEVDSYAGYGLSPNDDLKTRRDRSAHKADGRDKYERHDDDDDDDEEDEVTISFDEERELKPDGNR